MVFMKIVLVDSDDAFMSRMENLLKTVGFDCVKRVSPDKITDFVSRLAADEPGGVLILGAGISNRLRSSLIEQIRGKPVPFPVLTLAQPEAYDTIFESMATDMSDYICLPLRSKELITRVGILIRRAYPETVEDQVLRCGFFVFSRYPDRVSFRGRPIALTEKEYKLGRLFFEHIGKPLSRMTLSEAVWNAEEDGLSRTIDTHVSRVRNKLGLNEKNGFSLKQVYGFGYQLVTV